MKHERVQMYSDLQLCYTTSPACQPISNQIKHSFPQTSQRVNQKVRSRRIPRESPCQIRYRPTNTCLVSKTLLWEHEIKGSGHSILSSPSALCALQKNQMTQHIWSEKRPDFSEYQGNHLLSHQVRTAISAARSSIVRIRHDVTQRCANVGARLWHRL